MCFPGRPRPNTIHRFSSFKNHGSGESNLLVAIHVAIHRSIPAVVIFMVDAPFGQGDKTPYFGTSIRLKKGVHSIRTAFKVFVVLSPIQCL